MTDYKQPPSHEENWTALLSCFLRAHHARRRAGWVLDDNLAEALLGGEQYREIAACLAHGAAFLCPGAGAGEQLSDRAAEQLAPPVLARSAWCEQALRQEALLGSGQYLIFGAGYDTFAWRRPAELAALEVFELDRPAQCADKRRRCGRAGLDCALAHAVPCDLAGENWPQALCAAGFRPERRCVCSLLGLVWYLAPEELDALLGRLAPLAAPGSALLLDYPSGEACARTDRASALAAAAGQPMQTSYTERELSALLSRHGFLIYEHLSAQEMTERVFSSYNAAHPGEPMTAPAGAAYLRAVRR